VRRRAARDPLTQMHVEMPTEGPLTEAGLEIWPRGIYDPGDSDLAEFNHPIIEITENGCCYLDGPDSSGRVRMRGGLRFIGRYWRSWRGLSRMAQRCVPIMPGVWSITSSGGRIYAAIWVDVCRFSRPETDREGFGIWYGRVAGSNRLT